MLIHKKLIKIVAFYWILFLSINIVFGIFYYVVAMLDNSNTSFLQWLYFSMISFAGLSFGEVIPIPTMRPIIVIQFLFISSLTPIIYGFIFYYIINRPPKIVFPNNLILRKRTSEGSDNKLTLSIMVGNKNKHRVYDVRCNLIYIYYKKRFDGSIGQNAETSFIERVPYIQNYYRFSFELVKFPLVFINSLLNPDDINANDSIMIIVEGKYGDYGDNFLIEKLYNIRSVIIAKETSLISQRIIKEGNCTWSKPQWDNLNKIIYYDLKEEEELKKDITAILRK